MPMRRLSGAVFCLLLLGLNFPANAVSSRERNILRWKTTENKVEADLTACPLEKVLSKIQTLTRWEVLVEPNLRGRVTTRFKDVPSGEALRLLLGGYNFAVLPQPNGNRRLLVYRTKAQSATESVKISKDLILNELIVTLNPDSKESIESIAAKLGAKVLGRADDMKSYRLGFKDVEAAIKALGELGSDSNVASVDNNYVVHQPEVSPNVSDLACGAYTLNPLGEVKKLIVFMIYKQVLGLKSDMMIFLMDPLHVATAPTGESGELLHGTAMAETILHGLAATSEGSVSPVKILPIDVYGDSPTSNSFDVARGIRAGLENGSQIMVMSLGGDGESDYMAQAVFEAEQRGAVIVAAAGNKPTGLPVFPAAFEGVIGVTAIDRNGTIAPYANMADFVSAAGPGVSIVQYGNSRYMVTGTSASTAFLGGAAAGFWNPASGTPRTPDEIRTYLKTAFPVPK